MVKTELFNNINITGNMNFVLSSSPSSTSTSSSNSSYASTSPSSSASHLPSSPTHQTVQRNNTNVRVRQRHLTKSTVITINSKSPSSPTSSLSSPSSSSTSSSPLSNRNLSSASPQLKPLVRLIPKVTSQLNITSDQLYQPFTNLHNNEIVRSQSNCSSHLSNGYFSDSINSHWSTNEQISHTIPHNHNRNHLQHSQTQPQQNLHLPNSYPASSFQMGLNNNLYIPYPPNHHCSSSSASSPVPLVIDRQLTSTNDCPSMLPSCPKSKCLCLVPSTATATSLTGNFIQISSQPDSTLSPSPSSSSTITNNLCSVNVSSCANECSPQCTLPVIVNSNSSSSTAANTASSSNSNTSNKPSKPRRRVATMAQRRAANIRERRRMFHLNTAFDRLRKKVPTFAYEKRLSRIETLRLAVMYITFMTEILRGTSAKDCSPRIPLHPSTGSFQNHQIIDTSSSSSTSSDSSTSSSPIWESNHIHT